MSGTSHFFGSGLAAYARGLRQGQFTIEAATRACLNRIGATNERLNSFVYVANESAVETARALDTLLRSDTDLGPLMGVPVGIKDLYTVTGMPTRLGSRADLTDIIHPEGSFVRLLRAAGCVVLGKTRTTEFAMGGINLTHPTPWNPCAPDEHRTPGGSSGGSAVAVAALQCPWAIGSDTGGSIRQPAALCGIVGLKMSATRWPLDGIFSFSPTFDSLGYFTASVSDTAHVFCALQGAVLPTVHIEDLRLGRPNLAGFAELDADVTAAYESAVARLADAGVTIVPVDLPRASDIDDISRIVAIELIGRLGRQRLKTLRPVIDPVPLARLEATMDAADYIGILQRRQCVSETARSNMVEAGLDGWLLPTVPHSAGPLAELKTVDDVARWNARTFSITRLANMLDQVAISIPAPITTGSLPAGLQISSNDGRESKLLAMAMVIEQCLSAH
jgi:aspartyl-tRNA(Asn)/glutamyl-tRNA(Gln) amidotransferase subunit A